MRDDLNIPFPETNAGGEGFGRVSYGTRQSGMDPNTRRMALIAAGLGGGLLLVVGAWSMIAPRHAGVPVVQADSRPLREKPVNKGGLNVIGADEQGLSPDGDGKAVVAPAPEAPALAALQATDAPKPALVAPAAVASAPPVAEVPKITPLQDAAPSAVAARSGTDAKPVAPAVSPAPQPVPRVALTAPTAPAPVVMPPPPHPVARVEPRPAAVSGGRQVQLAAVGSQEAAQAEWQRLARKYPELLGSRRLEVSRFDRDGHVFWRVRTGGFTDSASASAFCSQIKAKGAACEVPHA
jgi:hypothetical protein